MFEKEVETLFSFLSLPKGEREAYLDFVVFVLKTQMEEFKNARTEDEFLSILYRNFTLSFLLHCIQAEGEGLDTLREALKDVLKEEK